MPEGIIHFRPRIFGRTRAPSVRGATAAERRHDALQSMATISALVAAGVDTVADPQLTRRRLHQIETEVHVLRELVQAHGEPRPLQTVDIAAEARAVVSSLCVDFPGAVGVLARASAPALITSTALRRVLVNLLRNAMRAAGDDGRVLVTVSRGAHDVSFVVDDDGPGLGALPVVHGLGLHSVRRLVHEAGGTVQTRTRGRLGGASVRVLLPAAGSEMAS